MAEPKPLPKLPDIPDPEKSVASPTCRWCDRERIVRTRNGRAWLECPNCDRRHCLGCKQVVDDVNALTCPHCGADF